VHPVLHLQPDQIDQRADADGERQPIVGQQRAERQQRQVERGEGEVAARLVDAAGRERRGQRQHRRHQKPRLGKGQG
jgi:hypothetical protein